MGTCQQASLQHTLLQQRIGRTPARTSIATKICFSAVKGSLALPSTRSRRTQVALKTCFFGETLATVFTHCFTRCTSALHAQLMHTVRMEFRGPTRAQLQLQKHI